ncbi:MAG: pectate lyase [Paraglaciecola sp.]|uniref:pectate lyase n=1 Tax=Paraglaciecola sp. TaxID=1920173 RepID=UPI0032985E87
MKKSALSFYFLFLCISLLFANNTSAKSSNTLEIAALDTMKRATTFMTQTVSYKGGYVWSYLPDFSRRWGEMEAKPTMVWVQPPGTATMGHLYLDAYHITNDEFYYQAAQQVASALIKGRHPSGGWNYMFDLAGEDSLKQWYETIGSNGWRLEEFHHYYGNATFDDAGTFDASVFLLRLYLEKKQPEYEKALNKAIQFVLESQYDIGGWPQRYPPTEAFSVKGQADYSRDITFNDDVANNNMKFLLYCLQSLKNDDLIKQLTAAVHKGMDAFVKLKLAPPQPGWALQYTLDLQPASARSYEPPSVSVGATVNNLELLLVFYQLTGNKKYLAGIPATLDWLDSLKLAPELIRDGRTHPRMVELGTGKTLYLHRRGSNVINGEYFIDYEPEYQVSHYPSIGRVNVDKLRQNYQSVLNSPMDPTGNQTGLIFENLPSLSRKYVISRFVASEGATDVQTIVQALNRQGFWPSALNNTTNPYIGPAPVDSIANGDYRTTHVGDQYDTSPYKSKTPTEGITLKTYLKNMSVLLNYLEQQHAQPH